MTSGWIGVDLDGTLCEYSEWVSAEHFGKPIGPMVERVKEWLQAGQSVKIFTARVSVDRELNERLVGDWTEKHLGQRLEVTNVKDYAMIALWDDRAVRVRFNRGEPCCHHHAL